MGHTYVQTDIQGRYKIRHAKTDKATDTGRHTHAETADRQTEKHAGRQTDTYKQTEKTDRQRDR